MSEPTLVLEDAAQAFTHAANAAIAQGIAFLTQVLHTGDATNA